MFALLSLCLPALAHLPHDQVQALAAPIEDNGFPWYLVVNPHESLLFESTDRGDSWQMVGGDPTRDLLLAAAMMTDGTALLVAQDTLWWRPAGEDEWRATPITGLSHLSRIAADDRVYVSVGDALWSGRPDEGLTSTTPFYGDIRDLRVSRRGTTAVDSTGQIWSLVDGDWLALGLPREGAQVAIADGELVWVGFQDGTVAGYWDGGWRSCGPLPEGYGDVIWYPDVIGFAYDDPALLAAPAWKTPMVSLDNCATWTRDLVAPNQALYEGEGGAETPGDAFTSLYADQGRWVVGGWGGVAVSADSGATWRQPMLLPPDYTRGLAFSPRYAEDGLLFVGAYTAGVIRSRDRGRTFDAPGQGLSQPNVQKIHVPVFADDASTIYGVINHTLWRSDDEGARWVGVELDAFSTVTNVRSFRGPERLWAMSTQTGPEGGSVVESRDGGETWAELPALTEALGTGVGQAQEIPLADGSYRVCAVGVNPTHVVCSDDGESWSLVHEAEAAASGGAGYAIASWPPGAAERLFVTGGGALVYSPDLGETWEAVDLGERSAQYLAAADDGTLFLSTSSARIFRSDDGGESWVDTGAQLPGSVRIMEPHPDFANVPDLWIGSHAGIFVLSDASGDAPALSVWGGFQRIDDTSSYAHAAEPCRTEGTSEGGISSRTPLVAGCTFSPQIYGHTLRVIAQVEAAGSASLWVDGVEFSTFGDQLTDGFEVVATVEGLEDGWHDVEIVGLSGDEVYFDAIEAYSEAAAFQDEGWPLPDTGDSGDSGPWDSEIPGGDDSGAPGPEEPNCSCASGPAGAGWWAWALLLAWRHRSRA